MTADEPTIRQAQIKDTSDLAFFLNQARYLHRHLDWRSSLEWLGDPFFWVLEQDGRIHATFACPVDPPQVSWVRLFASSSHINPDVAWKQLFEYALKQTSQKPGIRLAAISLHDWFERLLVRQGWNVHQHIVTLSWNGELPPSPRLLPGAIIRPILPEDLSEVTKVDNLAFEPLWQLSLETLQQAYEQSAIATLVQIDGQIVAYQMSTATSYNAHLARLAVLPDLQGKQIGYSLVIDLLRHLERLQVGSVTVNTQQDNFNSQALYKRLGFHYTGDQFPVLVYPH
jgi:ribosomal protein S18 acetylase RimI-like enzyme